jgi:hypothetical protein
MTSLGHAPGAEQSIVQTPSMQVPLVHPCEQISIASGGWAASRSVSGESGLASNDPSTVIGTPLSQLATFGPTHQPPTHSWPVAH